MFAMNIAARNYEEVRQSQATYQSISGNDKVPSGEDSSCTHRHSIYQVYLFTYFVLEVYKAVVILQKDLNMGKIILHFLCI